MSYLKVENLSYSYSKGTSLQHDAIKDVSFTAEKGQVIGLIGHTGSGKSTLLMHLNGLLTPSSGTVYLDGLDINVKKGKKKTNLKKVRTEVGLVFQYPEHQLFEETVYKDIAFGPKNMGLSEDEIKKRVYEVLDIVELDETLLEKSPFELSGGQMRRVAIAGVMAMHPSILILDEPTAGLDPMGKQSIIRNIMDYKEKHNSIIIISSHIMDDIAEICDKVLVMNHGDLHKYGTVNEVFSAKEELEGIGLNVPQITEIMYQIKNNGYDVSTDCFTLDEAVKEIVEKLGK